MAELYGDIRTVEEKTAEASEEQEEYRKRMDEMLTELEALKEEKKASEMRVKKIKDVISKMSKKEETTSDAAEESAEVVKAVEEKSIKDENANEVTKTKGSKYKKDVEKLKNDLQHLKDDTMPVTVTWDAAELRSELAPPWVCRWGRDEPMMFLEAVVVGTVRVCSSSHRLLLTLEEDGGWRHFFPFLSPREQRVRAGEKVVCRAVPLAGDPRGAEVPHTRTFPRWRREGEHRFGRVVMGRAMAEVEAERVVVTVEWDREEVVGSLEVVPGVVRVAHPAITGQLERWLRVHLRCWRAEDRLYLEVEGSNGKVTPYYGGVQDTRLLRTSGEWWWADPLCSGEGAEQGPGARLLGGVQGGGRQEAAQALPPLLQ